MAHPVQVIYLLLWPSIAYAQATPVRLSISNVNVMKGTFNPSRGQTTAIAYDVSRPAGVSIAVCDPNGFIVRRFERADSGEGNKHSDLKSIMMSAP
jgi:hypothetical protein